PAGLRGGVALEIGDDLAGGLGRGDLAGAAGGDDGAHAVRPGDRHRLVGRAVVDDEDLVLGVVEPPDVVERPADRRRRVVRADDDRDPRAALLAGEAPGRRRGDLEELLWFHVLPDAPASPLSGAIGGDTAFGLPGRRLRVGLGRLAGRDPAVRPGVRL